MATKIIHKKSSVASSVPASGDLQPGELAINLADKKIYSKTTGGSIIEMIPEQTPAELLAALKTVDGSGSGLDADTLDGLTASEYVTKAEEAQFSGMKNPPTDINNVVTAGEYRITSNNTNTTSSNTS